GAPPEHQTRCSITLTKVGSHGCRRRALRRWCRWTIQASQSDGDSAQIQIQHCPKPHQSPAAMIATTSVRHRLSRRDLPQPATHLLRPQPRQQRLHQRPVASSPPKPAAPSSPIQTRQRPSSPPRLRPAPPIADQSIVRPPICVGKQLHLVTIRPDPASRPSGLNPSPPPPSFQQASTIPRAAHDPSPSPTSRRPHQIRSHLHLRPHPPTISSIWQRLHVASSPHEPGSPRSSRGLADHSSHRPHHPPAQI
ncbi:hypothetical protein ACLOJK_022480, partial [Asimina triloba]